MMAGSALINGILKMINAIKKRNVDPYELAKESYLTEKDKFNIILGK